MVMWSTPGSLHEDRLSVWLDANGHLFGSDYSTGLTSCTPGSGSSVIIMIAFTGSVVCTKVTNFFFLIHSLILSTAVLAQVSPAMTRVRVT